MEKTVTYERGTSYGPKAIIESSHEVELFDDELNCEAYRQYGAATLKSFILPPTHKYCLKNLSEIVYELLQRKKFPLIFGGEHSLSGGSIKGGADFFGKELAILRFDARSDLRPSMKIIL